MENARRTNDDFSDSGSDYQKQRSALAILTTEIPGESRVFYLQSILIACIVSGCGRCV